MISLSEDEWRHLKVLWAEPKSQALFAALFASAEATLLDQLVAGPDGDYPVSKGRVMLVRSLYNEIEELALEEKYPGAKTISGSPRPKIRRLV